METKYITVSKPLITTDHNFNTCGGPEAFIPIINLKNVVEKLAWKAGTIHLKNQLEAPLPNFNRQKKLLDIGLGNAYHVTYKTQVCLIM